jgi:cytochrome c biogenesis protein CcmG/thiol:disulfide interchange protein DsbE
MPNKPRRPSARTAPASGAPLSTPPKKNLLWLWVALGAVVVLALGFAVLSAGDDEDVAVGSVPEVTEGTGVDGGTDSTVGESKGEVWPVTVTGDALAPLPQSGDDPALGQVAPGLSGYHFDGTPFTVDPSKGPVMLVYLAHWCPHCNREIPELLAWNESGAVPADLQVIGVTTAVDASRENYPPSSWIADAGWEWPVLADSQENTAALAMGVSSFPFTVILDTDGTVLSRWAGERGAEGIQELVDAALA